jgi:hypothetical protein
VIAWVSASLPKVGRDWSAKLLDPVADGLARKTQTEILMQILYITIIRHETSIEPDGMANKLKREVMVFEGDSMSYSINKSN